MRSDGSAKYDPFDNKLTLFGYKVHLAVYTASQLPVSLEATPSEVHDGEAITWIPDIAKNDNL